MADETIDRHPAYIITTPRLVPDSGW